MNSEIDKKYSDEKLKDSEKDGQYAVDDSDLKKDTDQEATEDSPLKGEKVNTDSKENDASGPGGEKSGAKEGAKGLREWLSKSRVKWWIAVLVAIVLLTVVLVGTLLAVEDDDYDIPDNSIRLVKVKYCIIFSTFIKFSLFQNIYVHIMPIKVLCHHLYFQNAVLLYS